MEIKLSNEIITKIICVAFGRLKDLNEKEKNAKEWIAVRSCFERKEQLERVQSYLKDIRKEKADSEEVYSLFMELSEQLKM